MNAQFAIGTALDDAERFDEAFAISPRPIRWRKSSGR